MTLIALAIALLLLGFMIGGLRGAVWVPARLADTQAIITSLGIASDAHIYEFGSGDGRNLRLIRQLLPNVRLSAIEINPVMWLIAKITTSFGIRITLGDGWHADLSDQDVVITFLTPPFMQKFETKTCQEMKSGSLVVSYAFKLPNLTPLRVEHSYFVYQIP